MTYVKREIVGEREVTEEWIRKEWVRKHLVNQIVFRRIEQHVVLSCGHTRPKGYFGVIPKRTGCYTCTEALENEAQSALLNVDTAPDQVQGAKQMTPNCTKVVDALAASSETFAGLTVEQLLYAAIAGTDYETVLHVLTKTKWELRNE